jgi:hypothetical protein
MVVVGTKGGHFESLACSNNRPIPSPIIASADKAWPAGLDESRHAVDSRIRRSVPALNTTGIARILFNQTAISSSFDVLQGPYNGKMVLQTLVVPQIKHAHGTRAEP